MHKGRSYPYHPTFWVGSTYYWPGFLPWKFNLSEALFFFGPVFSLDPLPVPNPSEPGIILSVSEVLYRWVITSVSSVDLLELVISDVTISSVRYAEWKVTLSLLGVEVQTVYCYLIAPQTGANNSGGTWSLTRYDIPPLTQAEIGLGVATYAQGGSPWV